MFVPFLRKAVLPLYRTFSLFSCYAILLAILGYGAAFVFYIASSGRLGFSIHREQHG